MVDCGHSFELKNERIGKVCVRLRSQEGKLRNRKGSDGDIVVGAEVN